MSLTQIDIALIGCGDMGMHLAGQAASIDGVRIVAGYDPDPARRQIFTDTFGHAASLSVADALAASGVSLVIVATPPVLHRPMVEAAAAAGKHVFCEKPLAPTLADCDAIIAACQRAGVQLMVGHVLRFIQPYAAIYEAVVRQRLAGEVFSMEMRRFAEGFAPSARRQWRQDVDQCGGMLMEINAHELDFLRHICGEAVSVQAMGGNFVHSEFNYEDLSHITVEFAGGTIGSVHASMASAFSGNEGIIQGTKGTLLYRWGSGPLVSFDPADWSTGSFLSFKGFDGSEQQIPISSDEDPYRHELRLFVEALRAGQAAPISGADGRAAVELALAAYRASYDRFGVTLPLPEDTVPISAAQRVVQHRTA